MPHNLYPDTLIKSRRMQHEHLAYRWKQKGRRVRLLITRVCPVPMKVITCDKTWRRHWVSRTFHMLIIVLLTVTTKSQHWLPVQAQCWVFCMDLSDLHICISNPKSESIAGIIRRLEYIKTWKDPKQRRGEAWLAAINKNSGSWTPSGGRRRGIC